MEPEENRQIKYLILIDFQATCDQNHQLKPCQQIIQLTASVFTIQTRKHTNNFHQFVKPSCNPKLTEFCKKYTSISQNQIKEARNLQSALKNLKEWFHIHDFLQPDNYTVGSWGSWGIMKCLKKECQVKKIEIPDFIHSFINVKQVYEKLFHKKAELNEIGSQIQFEEEATKGQKNINHLYYTCCKIIEKDKRSFIKKDVYPLIEIPNVTVTKQLGYLLVLDFQATCEEGKKPDPCPQIIEFPVMVVDLAKLTIIDQFHEYITPKFNKKLTPFCTQLTGITQDMVTNKISLEEVLDKLEEWISTLPYLHSRNFTFVTCGDWDLATCLKKECKVKNLMQPEYLKNYINIKKAFLNCVPEYDRSMGMMGMLKALNIEHEGRHHSGIDDVRNICSICIGLTKKGLKFNRSLISYVK